MDYDEDYEPEDEPGEDETGLEQQDLEEIFQAGGEAPVSRERTGANRLGKPFLGRLAVGRLVAARSARLQQGARSPIPTERLVSRDLQDIAKQELVEKVIPIRIRRNNADGTFEYWNINEFTFVIRDIFPKSPVVRGLRRGDQPRPPIINPYGVRTGNQ